MREMWTVTVGESPIIATAIHNGHAVRPDIADLLSIDEQTRLHEEDPYTEEWTQIAPVRVVPKVSRFEVDLNRQRNRAMYKSPEMAWGLQLWRHRPSREQIKKSLSLYDEFYDLLYHVLGAIAKKYHHFVVFDFHSYNYRREGAGSPPADPAQNPEVNVGTGSIDKATFQPLVERFIGDLRRFDFEGRNLDVRENVKFQGRHLAKWVHERFPRRGCVLAVDVKKFFMDEWTGKVDGQKLSLLREAFASTIPGLMDELNNLEVKWNTDRTAG